MAAFLKSWRNSSGQLKLWSPLRTSNETLLGVMYTGQILCHSFNDIEVMVGRGEGGRIPLGVPDDKELGPSRLKSTQEKECTWLSEQNETYLCEIHLRSGCSRVH